MILALKPGDKSASRSDEPPVGADVWRRGRAPPRGRARPPELHQNRDPDGRSRAAREPERVGTWRGPDGERRQLRL